MDKCDCRLIWATPWPTAKIIKKRAPHKKIFGGAHNGKAGPTPEMIMAG
jgi:hypothetical protein